MLKNVSNIDILVGGQALSVRALMHIDLVLKAKAACHVTRLGNQELWTHNRATRGLGIYFSLYGRNMACTRALPKRLPSLSL